MGFLKRFPSHDQLVKSAWGTARRFPLALLSAATATSISMYMIEHESMSSQAFPMNLLVVAAMGIPLFIVLTIFAERRGLSTGASIVMQAVAVLLLVGYYFTLPAGFVDHPQQGIRFFVLSLSLHFLVAFMPFVGRDQIIEFWQYNKTLFLRFLVSALYAAVMFIGLAIALAAADKLFVLEIKPERYAQLWAFLVGIFNTWCFMAGIPERDEALDKDIAFPRGLKVFVQFVLLPLVGIYSVILFAYEAKIVIQWNLPKGWVSQLVLWYAVVGILSMLLLYPLRLLTENRWIQKYITWFFRAMIPLIVMLFAAIFRRIADYGITEARYFVLVMAVALTLVCIYFIVSRVKDIRVIPMVLFVIGVVSVFGPWSAFDVSLRSQQSRLDGLLIEYRLPAEAAGSGNTEGIPCEDQQEMSNLVRYLNEFHDYEAFDRWLNADQLDTLATLTRWDRPARVAGMLGFKLIAGYVNEGEESWFRYDIDKNFDMPVSGYEWMCACQVQADSAAHEFSFGEEASCWIGVKDDMLSVLLGQTQEEASAVQLDLAETARALARVHGYEFTSASHEEMTYTLPSDTYRISVMISSLHGSAIADTVNIVDAEVLLMVGRKE